MKIKWFFCCMIVLCIATAAQCKEPEALRTSSQILVVTTADWNGVAGTLQVYERPQAHKKWKAVGDPIQVVVGKKGLGWGAGLATADDIGTRGVDDPVKHEGDIKSPAGIFRLSTAFGYAAQKPQEWKMPYVVLTPSVECVDDAHSKFYNRVLDRASVTPDWNSSEHMLLSNGEYKWGLVVDHNAEPVTAGTGSCVFMHIWLGPDVGTTGCTAMTQEHLEGVIARLDPAKNPLLVQLPRAEFKRLKRHWKLPKQPSEK